MITFGSLFAGIGGFDLGFERAGMDCAWTVEIDKRCNEVLAHHWPIVKQYKDIRDVGRHNLKPVDVICGGFPCQDLSVAGRRAGLAGERSGLWGEFHRIIEELQPRWVVIENVPGLLSSNKGRDMGTIIRALGQLGYGYAWTTLDAQFFGVAQRRRRVFIVGCLGDWRSATKVLFESESGCWDSRVTKLPKVFKRDDFLIGYSTSFRMGQLLQHQLVIPPRGKRPVIDYMVTVFVESVRACLSGYGYTKIESNQEEAGEFLVGYGGRLFLVASDFQVNEYVEDYTSIGCGAPYALGAMKALDNLTPKKRITKSLKIAAHFSNGVQGPFCIKEL